MWRYQKPGFEAVLLAELQRQQRCSQFCDTMLTAEGVSVPAHSCVLSAISPHILSALSSTMPPPAGQSHLLEFRTLGTCTLLQMVRLLYSGEMTGEGEEERQEAISAAAKLGIHGLVEVTKSGRKGRSEEGEGRGMEVGVQTEPMMPEENERRPGKWRREVMDGNTYLWKETPSDGRKDMWAQTEELQVNTTQATHSDASRNSAALQAFEQVDSQLLPLHVPHIPVSLIYPPEENQASQPPSAPAASMQDSTGAGHISDPVVAQPYSSFLPSLLPLTAQTTLCAAETQSWWTGPVEAATDVEGEEWAGKQLEQFQGNIPEFINHFLNPEKEESPGRGRAGRRRGARVRVARRAGSGERQARRPRARTGGLMQTVDVQEVGVSKLQKLFLQRWGMTPRTGQGGGAAGRKLYVKTRGLLQPPKSCQRRRGHGKVWELSQSGDMLLHSKRGRGGGGTQCGGGSATQDSLPAGRAGSVFFSATPMQLCSNNIVSSSSLQPSLSAILPSPSASYMPPAPSLFHTSALPPLVPPPQQGQPGHMHLLEEVMIGLDILPNANNNSAPSTQPPLPASSSGCAGASSGSYLARNEQQACTTGLLGEGPGLSVQAEVPVLQQQGERELNEILDHFLQAFEQHADSSGAMEGEDVAGGSSAEASKPHAVQKEYRQAKTRTIAPRPPHLHNAHIPRPANPRPFQIVELQESDETPPIHSQQRNASAVIAAPPKNAKGTAEKVPAKRKNRRKRQHSLSLDRKKKKKKKKPVSASPARNQILCDRGDKQLQQMPVVKLKRTGPLPARVTLQGHSCQFLEVKKLYPASPNVDSLKDEEMEGSSDEIADVDGDADGRAKPEERTDDRGGRVKKEQSGPAATLSRFISSPSHPAKTVGTGSTGGSGDEDIDVTGASSPVPEPVIISWKESPGSEEEEEDMDVDIVGGISDCASSAVCAAVVKGELVHRAYKPEML